MNEEGNKTTSESDKVNCWDCNSVISIYDDTCPVCKADLTESDEEEVQATQRSDINVSKGFDVWDSVHVASIFVIGLSIIAGFVIINEFGWTQIDLWGGGVRTEINLIGMGSGIAVIVQGTIMGILMLAFSKLGGYVKKIMNQLDRD